MLKRAVILACLAVAGYLAYTVNLGERTLYGHMLNIWNSDEMIEMREDLSKLGSTSLAAPPPSQ